MRWSRGNLVWTNLVSDVDGCEREKKHTEEANDALRSLQEGDGVDT